MNQPTHRLSDDVIITCYVAQGVVSDVCGVPEELMLSRCRNADAAYARHFLFYILNVIFCVKEKYIKSLFGWDRTSVYHAVNATSDRLATERDAVNDLKSILFLLGVRQ